MTRDVTIYREALQRFLNDQNYFEPDEFEDADSFLQDIQQNPSPEYKRSCGNKLWRFYTEYLGVRPDIAAEDEEILKHMVETILTEGYAGILLILDEVSLFMKDRVAQRTADEKTLVVLSNRLAKVNKLPIWTVCAAQQALEGQMGVKNIIAEERLKLVELLKNPEEYYTIVLSRVREIKDQAAIGEYYQHYKAGFSAPAIEGEQVFSHFFPFHKSAIEVLRDITYQLTTTRSAIHFMHQTMKHQLKNNGGELIRLWELFDETVEYEEDPSGVHSSLVAIRTKREDEYHAYEVCKRHINSITAARSPLRAHRERAIRIMQTLFLYYLANMPGLTAEDTANAVLLARDEDSDIRENIEHYETLLEELKKEIQQVTRLIDDDGIVRYRFNPVLEGAINPQAEFERARNAAESDERLREESWKHLLALDSWPVKTRQMTIDMSQNVKSPFREISPYVGPWANSSAAKAGDKDLEIIWKGRSINGLIGMRDFTHFLDGPAQQSSSDNDRTGRDFAGQAYSIFTSVCSPIDSDRTGRDFAVLIGLKPLDAVDIGKLLTKSNDGRVILWVPSPLSAGENERLLDFAACRKLISQWSGKDSDDAIAVIHWVNEKLQK